MATFNERISVVIDVVTDKATNGFKDFRTAVGEANGFTGKLKAGVSSLGSVFTGAVGGPAALGAAVAGGAKIALDAAQEWAALGEQVDNFSASTGLSYEAASRLLEVTGDLGIDAGTLESVLGKLNKSIDPKVFNDLGVSIARTSTGAVDTAATFDNVLQTLRDIKDPAERAATGAKLLGKGWQSVAPLIARSADDIKSQLEGVADVKVFNADDIKKAKEFQQAWRDLSDKVREVTMRLGKGFVPVLADSLNGVIKLADGFAYLDEKANVFGFSLTDLAKGPMAAAEYGWNKISDAFSMWWNATDTEKIVYTGKSITNLGDSAGYAARYVGLASQKQDAAQQTAAKLATNVREATTAYKNLKSELTSQKTLVDLKLQLEGNAQKLKDLKKDFDEGKLSGRDYMLEVASATLDSKLAIEGYAEALGNVPPDVTSDVVLNFDPYAPGNIDAELNRWAKNKTVFVSVALGGVTVDPTRKPDNPVNNPPKPGGNTNVTIKVDVAPGGNPVATGRAVHDALQAYYRSGGERP